MPTTITMTAAQTEIYNGRDDGQRYPMMDALREEARAASHQDGHHYVEIYTADGIVADVRRCDCVDE